MYSYSVASYLSINLPTYTVISVNGCCTKIKKSRVVGKVEDLNLDHLASLRRFFSAHQIKTLQLPQILMVSYMYLLKELLILQIFSAWL